MVVDPVSSRATQFSNGVNLVHATSPRIRYRHARVFVAKQFRHRRSSQKRNILSSVDCSNRLSTQIPQTSEHCERNVFPSTHSFLSFPFHRATSYFFLLHGAKNVSRIRYLWREIEHGGDLEPRSLILCKLFAPRGEEIPGLEISRRDSMRLKSSLTLSFSDIGFLLFLPGYKSCSPRTRPPKNF